MSAKSFDKALEIQSDYMRSAYEGFVAQATKFSELAAGHLDTRKDVVAMPRRIGTKCGLN